MREPEWIEHDGSKGCPVPAGHDVEVRFRNGKTSRDCCPEGWVWHHWTIKSGNVTHYRDWTAFEQNSAGEVPEREVIEAVISAYHTTRIGRDFVPHIISKPGVHEAFARYIAAHDPEPVDLLLIEAREVVAKWAESIEGFGPYADDYRSGKRDKDSEIQTCIAALCRGMELARGVTMEKNNG